jgi:membrane-bound ClpP family serine protease
VFFLAAFVLLLVLPSPWSSFGGETWGARCPGGAATGDTVRVVRLDGLTLIVDRVAAPEPAQSETA